MTEKELVNLFVKQSENYSIKVLHIETSPHSKHMDCEFIYEGQYVRAEAKVFNDTRNSSQNFIKIFGGILKGRSLPIYDTTNKLPVVYAVLIDDKQYEMFTNRTSTSITPKDWLDFGNTYDAKYIFTVNEKTGDIQYANWDEL
ncbi:hypothetical protein ACH434_17690 [Lysinibacillus fusiformis]|uniref:hypothetical protein n=1 Tax=Lysinibacillus fusiformis TaxID=28031 RepID=UPI0037A8BB5F